MMIKSMEKHLRRNDYVYFCYNLSIINIIYVILEEGSGENIKCMKYVGF
jgi:hypothetical protein